MKRFWTPVFSLSCVYFTLNPVWAQSVRPLISGITADSIAATKPGATKLALDPIGGRLFYATYNGDIYEVFAPAPGVASDSLRYTSAEHGINAVQGLCFRDSVMYLCGNNWSATTSIGKVVKGALQPNGTRIWSNIATTAAYPSASSGGDHGFTGVQVDPEGNYIYVSSGARTHLGEIRTNNGAWPSLREVPLTCHIFRFPIQSVGIFLPNDSLLLAGSGYVFANGTRNAYDMAWDGNNTLFAIDNSGERDDPEELNWLREGRHYGYPWRMGGNDNPLRFSPYHAGQDPLVNPLSGGYLSGWLADTPGFPPPPQNTVFAEPVRNFGTVADYYRDPVTGSVRKASDEGTYISTFTAHRSPLGLVFDRDSLLAAPFRGDGFVLSFMPGGDSAGYTPLSPWGSPCPFVDPSRALIQMKLVYDAAIDNYTMTTRNVVDGFYLPVDAELTGNVLYVLENGGDIWKITFPAYVAVNDVKPVERLSVFPNPFDESAVLEFDNKGYTSCDLTLYDAFGKTVQTIQHIRSNRVELQRMSLSPGVYFFQLRAAGAIIGTGKIIVK